MYFVIYVYKTVMITHVYWLKPVVRSRVRSSNCYELKLRDMYSIFKIIFGGVIIVLTNKSITTRSFTLLSVLVMI